MVDAQRIVKGITDKHVREIVRSAARGDWDVSLTHGNHVRLRHNSGAVVFAPLSSSDWRTARNLQANINRVERGEDPR